MIKKILEPDAESANLEDWYALIHRTIAQGGGYNQIMITDIDKGTSRENTKVKSGSRFEFNNTFYAVDSDTEIEGLNDVNYGWVYVYAYLDPNDETAGIDGTVKFKYDNKPIWVSELCGYYKGNSRALAKMFRHSDNMFYNKVILYDFNSLLNNNYNNAPASGGTLVTDLSNVTSAPVCTILNLKKGLYQFEMSGGQGGRGGTGSNGAAQDTDASVPITITGTFRVHEGDEVIAKQGQGGGDGGNGNYNTVDGSTMRTGGGSAANGGASFIKVGNKYYTAPGTQGTAGTDPDSASVTKNGASVNLLQKEIDFSNEHPSTLTIAGRQNGNAAGSLSASYVSGPPNYNVVTVNVNGGAGGTYNNSRNGKIKIYKIWEEL